MREEGRVWAIRALWVRGADDHERAKCAAAVPGSPWRLVIAAWAVVKEVDDDPQESGRGIEWGIMPGVTQLLPTRQRTWCIWPIWNNPGEGQLQARQDAANQKQPCMQRGHTFLPISFFIFKKKNQSIEKFCYELCFRSQSSCQLF